MISWGKKDEQGAVTADRDRMIQLVVDEFRDKRIPVNGTEDEWYEYWLDWSNLTRIDVEDNETGALKGHKWVRSGRDHRALATVFWRVGMSRFSEGGFVFGAESEKKDNSYTINPDGTASFNPNTFFNDIDEADWRL
jgi:hypothetical protein